MQKSSTEEFIKRAKLIKNNAIDYDYSKSIYLGSGIKLIIGCNRCGLSFPQKPNHHLRGVGCPQCANNQLLTTEQFVARAKLVKDNDINFCYNNAIYTGTGNKLIITCNIHGDFLQYPRDHLDGFGCSKCSGRIPVDTERFIYLSTKIHGNRYDYSKSQCKIGSDVVEIICPIHDSFFQVARDHYRGSGCQQCACENFISKGETEWLDSLNINPKSRQLRLPKIAMYVVDGFCVKTNTIFEFNGDYWHGNPMFYDPSHINEVCGISFGELYIRTINKENAIKKAGYNLITIWENEWEEIKKNNKNNAA